MRRRRKSPAIVQPASWNLPPVRARRTGGESYLVPIALATVVAWQFPLGHLALYPFTLLATWFHEMGHGLTAALLGADFQRLVIFPDASGFAEMAIPADMGNVDRAAIAAAGLLGPGTAGAAMIASARSARLTRVVLALLGVALVAATVIWVRSPVGWLVLPAFAGLALAAAVFFRPSWQRFTLELLGVQAAISVWQDLGYLFSSGATVGGMQGASDTGAISAAIGMPYWFWGGLITVTVVALIVASLRFARGGRKRR